MSAGIGVSVGSRGAGVSAGGSGGALVAVGADFFTGAGFFAASAVGLVGTDFALLLPLLLLTLRRAVGYGADAPLGQ